MSELREFVRESNQIEGILRRPTEIELMAHAAFLSFRSVRVRDLCHFVFEVARAELRERAGMDVFVGSHEPPQGGPHIRRQLKAVLADLDYMTPYEAHVAYEMLHPFTDGNGRSGRVLWAWLMRRDGQDPFALPFLHRFYYQALDAQRAPGLDVAIHGDARADQRKHSA